MDSLSLKALNKGDGRPNNEQVDSPSESLGGLLGEDKIRLRSL